MALFSPPDGKIKAIDRDLDLTGLLITICDLSHPSRGSTGPVKRCVFYDSFKCLCVYMGTFIMSRVSRDAQEFELGVCL